MSHYPAENLVGQYATGYGDRTDEQKFEDIKIGQGFCLEAGYTSIQDVIVGNKEDIFLYKQFADSGLLKVRLYTMLYLDFPQQADSFAKYYTPIDSGLFRFGGWKMAMDGGLAAGTILMYDKTMSASQISYQYHSQDELNRMVKTLYNTGLQVAVHVSGDEGIDMTLTAFEEAMNANPRPDPRLRIEHGLFPTASALQRMKAGNIILSTQPQWITWYGDGYARMTDDATMKRLLPLKTMLDGGIRLAFGCDVPASLYQEPKFAFYGAVIRKGLQSETVYNPIQKLTIQEALRIHTMGSAYAGFADSTTGSLEPGKYADLVIWSHDMYTMDPSEVINLAAEMTIVGGQIAFDAGKNPVNTIAEYWIAAGNMLRNRQDHTATMLKNGKVLIVGWDSNQAESYDPATDSFIATGSTKYNHRQGFTATLLNSGKVLIAGGINAQRIVELYDPGTGTFSLTDSLNAVHSYHTATLLSDGRVLIAGGQDNNGPQTHAVSEIYNPQSGMFGVTGSLKVDRSGHTATLLPNNHVLIAGGIQTTTPGSANYINSCELYNPATGTFSLIKKMDQPRTGHTATLLKNNQVLIAGGAWNKNYNELYDYQTGTWTLTGNMAVIRRSYHTATLLQDGNVLLAGGFVTASTASAEIYDPSANTFSVTDSMITPRMEHTATQLPDGSVLVTGGYGKSGAINLAERFLADMTTLVHADNPMNGLQSLPESFLLSQNYPNPFNPSTTIQFKIPFSTHVELYIYNILGKRIRTLVDRSCDAGLHSVQWDGLDDAGNQIPGGIYLSIMKSSNYKDIKKVIFLK